MLLPRAAAKAAAASRAAALARPAFAAAVPLGCPSHARCSTAPALVISSSLASTPRSRSSHVVRCQTGEGASVAAGTSSLWPSQLLHQKQEQQQLEQLQQAQEQLHQPPQQQYCVLNFYHLVDVPDPEGLVERHRAFLSDKDVRGRIYISSQGINCQCGGTLEDATAFAEWAAAQPEFQGLRYSIWPAEGHMFPKLRLKLKPNLISLAGGMAELPVTDPASRATPLNPEEWRRMLAEAQASKDAAEGKKRVVVLDVRNDYEWDAGHFVGAQRPAEEEFAETPVVASDDDLPEPLKDVDKDTPVMMYCTGGIRCDVYSSLLKQRGYNNLYSLEGGVQAYLREQGPEHWNGSLFVFDGRLAIPPSGPDAKPPSAAAQEGGLPAAVPCQLCGTRTGQLPHMNCANIDCNELFISCVECRDRYHGCCCDRCMAAPRLLRPIKLTGGQYGNWNDYAEEDSVGPLIATGRSSEGRLARRRRRREALRAKRQEYLAERRAAKQAMKQQAKEAIAKLEASHNTEQHAMQAA